MKKIIFIKFGGSIITDKKTPLTPNLDAISRLSRQFSRVYKELSSEYSFIIGNGAGSYGHYFADMYKTGEGIKSEKQLEGFVVEQFYDAELNRLLIKHMLDDKTMVQTFHPSSMFQVASGRVKKVFVETLLGALKLNIVPSVYGNLVYDSQKGCHILSTEVIFHELIKVLLKKQFQIHKVVYVTSVDGFLKSDGTVIPKVNRQLFPSLKKYLYEAQGFDVTGGMGQKISEALKLAKKGIQTQIVNGNTEDILIKTFIDNAEPGTLVY